MTTCPKPKLFVFDKHPDDTTAKARGAVLLSEIIHIGTIKSSVPIWGFEIVYRNGSSVECQFGTLADAEVASNALITAWEEYVADLTADCWN